MTRLGDLRKQIADVEACALDFHTSEFDGRKALEILSTIGEIGRELSFLENCRYIQGEYQDSFIDFRQAYTDKNFDKTQHAALTHDDALCLSIMATRAQLDAKLIDFQTSVATSALSPEVIIVRSARRLLAFISRVWSNLRRSKFEDEY